MKLAVVFFHVGLILLVGYLLARRWGEIKSKLYWSAFACHLLAGICVGLVYLYYYTSSDTWLFFDGAKQLSTYAHHDFGTYLQLLFNSNVDNKILIVDVDSRSLVFIKILSLFSFVTRGNYWVCSAYFSLLSFSASWFLFTKVEECFPESTLAAAIAFLFFPSVVFWSSGIVKETLTLASLYFLAGILLQIFYARKIDKLVWIAVPLAIFLLWTIKYYWAGVFFIAATSAFVVEQASSKFSLAKKSAVLSYVLCFLIIGVAVSFLHPNFYIDQFLEVVVSNHDAFVKLSNDSNLIHYHELQATVKSILINSPWALISGIFRPIIGEGQGTFGLLASFENFALLVLFISFLYRFRNKKYPPLTILGLAVISYCTVLCVFLALSAPNFGTLSRYRVGFLPFLIFILAYRNPLLEMFAKKLSN